MKTPNHQLPRRQVLRTRKKHRNKLKNVDPLGRCERQPVEFISLEVSTRVLANPKQKLSAKSRKRFLRSRSNVIVAPVTPAIASPIKYAKRLSRLGIAQLSRELEKAARRAATAKYILDTMSPDSPFRPPVVNAQNAQIHRGIQARAEALSRIKSN